MTKLGLFFQSGTRQASVLGYLCCGILAVALAACSGESPATAAGGASSGSGTGGGGGGTAACPFGDVGDGWQVGVSVEDVTPTPEQIATGKLYMGAYGLLTARGPATGVHDPVYARAMVLRTGCKAVVFTILDMPGASNRILHRIADAVHGQTQIPKEDIYVGSTHSHSAPDLQGLWGGVPEDYKTRVVDLTSKAITDAFAAAAPADLLVSKGEGPNRNRRDWGFTDKELTVLDAQAKDGTRIGTLVNFAAHPVILGEGNKEISRDFCGYTVDHVETTLVAKDKVLFFNGVLGDASPDGGTGATDFDRAQDYGRIVGDVALATMSTQTPVTAGIYRDYLPWEQEVTNANFKLVNNLGYLDYDANVDMANDKMSIDTQTSYLRLGTEIQAVMFPGEALTRTGLKVKDMELSPFRLWLGLTTDSLGYFVLSDEWNVELPGGGKRNDGYEETVSCGMDAGDNAVKILLDAIAKDVQ
jgi:hypothetical protein